MDRRTRIYRNVLRYSRTPDSKYTWNILLASDLFFLIQLEHDYVYILEYSVHHIFNAPCRNTAALNTLRVHAWILLNTPSVHHAWRAPYILWFYGVTIEYSRLEYPKIFPLWSSANGQNELGLYLRIKPNIQWIKERKGTSRFDDKRGNEFERK
jgi:hypothetical protein